MISLMLKKMNNVFNFLLYEGLGVKVVFIWKLCCAKTKFNDKDVYTNKINISKLLSADLISL